MQEQLFNYLGLPLVLDHDPPYGGDVRVRHTARHRDHGPGQAGVMSQDHRRGIQGCSEETLIFRFSFRPQSPIEADPLRRFHRGRSIAGSRVLLAFSRLAQDQQDLGGHGRG